MRRTVCLGGMSKGSGMIHPNMATMLGTLTCNAGVPADVWQAMVSRTVDRSFNAITVDGDTSTNDTFLAFAAGERLGPEYFDALEAGLTAVSQHLAQAIARDGVPFDPNAVALWLGEHQLMAAGPAPGVAWGCDLSDQSVRINADYTT